MPETRKHHYVPQCYLRQFACQKPGNPRVFVFDKNSRKSFSSEIKDVAEQRDFYKINDNKYSIPMPDNDPLYYEHLFSRLFENQIPTIINQIKMLHTMTVPNKEILSFEMKKSLSILLQVQLLRTPQARKFVRNIVVPIWLEEKERVKKAIQDKGDFPNKEKYLMQLDEFNDIEPFVKSYSLIYCTDIDLIESHVDYLIKNHAWVIYDNLIYQIHPFITSDNPVVMYNLKNEDMGLGTSNGLDVDDTAFFFPLTPRFLLTLYHRRNFIGEYSEDYENRIQSVDDFSFISRMNDIQFRQCDRFCYSNLSFTKQISYSVQNTRQQVPLGL